MIAANVLSKEEFPDFDEETGILPKVDDEEGNQPLRWSRMMGWEDSWQVEPWIGFICSLTQCLNSFVPWVSPLISQRKRVSLRWKQKASFF